MSVDKRPNDDVYTAAVVAAAHVGSMYCQSLMALAEDDRAERDIVFPEEMASLLRSVGVSCTHYADPESDIPERLWHAAACGRWVLVWVLPPGLGSGSVWCLLDGCYDHPRRLLRITGLGDTTTEWDPADHMWTGHSIVMMSGPLPEGHASKGMPSPN